MPIRKIIASLFGNREQKPQAQPSAGFRIAPIIKDPVDRGLNVEYRRPGDDRWVIRINQPQPKGTPKKLHGYVQVAGASFRRHDIERFIRGTEREVTLQREPDNPKDKNAITVYGAWLEDGSRASAQLGYVPGDVSAKLIHTPRLGARLETMFLPHDRKAPGLRISIWGPASRRKTSQSSKGDTDKK